MDCEHCSHEINTDKPNEEGTIPLTKNDIAKIRNGKFLEFHFHGSQFYNKRLNIYIALPGKNPTSDSDFAQQAQQTGDNLPIMIDKKNLLRMQTEGLCVGTKIEKCTPNFELYVMTAKQYSKQIKEKRKNHD